MINARLEHVAAGGNRHPSSADWAPHCLAFGAGINLAIWDPQDKRQSAVDCLLAGHTDVVNAVKILDLPSRRLIISGGADHSIRIWSRTGNGAYPYFAEIQCLTDHSGSINTISCLPLGLSGLFATGAADGTVKIWQLERIGGAELVQSIPLKPHYLPLATAFIALSDGTTVLAVAGTFTSIQLHVRAKDSAEFELQATLTGHEGWIRSLDFTAEKSDENADLLLASASQDKYIRLWRLRKVDTAYHGPTSSSPFVGKKSLSNKTHKVGSLASKYSVTFEALLIGHEDWIYTAKWASCEGQNFASKLLSASADSSLAVWTADEASGVWICNTRLGEISAQKGSTTATGSTGGFWIGLWGPKSQDVVSLGRTGSWRRWTYDQPCDAWVQQIGVSGHTQEVQSLAWAADGSYLLTTGSDQTTRLFAEWKRDDQSSWHEFARPQIHGYNLNCIDTLTTNQFISGADEKLLRVFNKPKAIDKLLSKLAGLCTTVDGELADAANIPVLGLSNKAIAAEEDDEIAGHHCAAEGVINEREPVHPASVRHTSTLDLEHPPFEDHLARHTLWPEHEKLYGHGYEISAVAASHNHLLVATACKASSVEHAVIRLFETKEWREVKPPLTAHSLTVTALAFSPDDQYLLSVGRDRQWAVFERVGDSLREYKFLTSNPKGHARMILDCSWAPHEVGHVFATAGRDKVVKIWHCIDSNAETTSLTAPCSVTAVAFAQKLRNAQVWLAFGTEDGALTLANLDRSTLRLSDMAILNPTLCPSQTVSSLHWRPATEQSEQLAAASADGSIRILSIEYRTSENGE